MHADISLPKARKGPSGDAQEAGNQMAVVEVAIDLEYVTACSEVFHLEERPGFAKCSEFNFSKNLPFGEVRPLCR
jgi:hypothetical protein